jgi:hypothetical protein
MSISLPSGKVINLAYIYNVTKDCAGHTLFMTKNGQNAVSLARRTHSQLVTLFSDIFCGGHKKYTVFSFTQAPHSHPSREMTVIFPQF